VHTASPRSKNGTSGAGVAATFEKKRIGVSGKFTDLRVVLASK